MSSSLLCLSKNSSFIGTARTIKCTGDFLPVLSTLQDSKQDDVLVIDGGGTELAILGELFATEAQRRGLAGIIVDGCVRDREKLDKLDIPIYARATCPMAGSAVEIPVSTDQVHCGGTSVVHGDVVIGDDDGLVVITLQRLIQIVPSARLIQAREEALLENLEIGKSLFDFLNLESHLQALQNGDISQLEVKL